MEARPLHGFIVMGAVVRMITDVQPGWPIFGQGQMFEQIEKLLEDLDAYGMKVSAGVAAPLRTMRDSFAEELRNAPDEEGLVQQRRFKTSESDQLGSAANAVRNTMLAEAKGKFAFVTRDKRYDVGRLLERVDTLMAPGIYDLLPPLAQYDLGQAGKAIAFELPTAAAFHLMRATEEVLRFLYRSIVIEDRVDPLLWFSMTEHLRRCADPPPEVLLANLDNIRKSFRNPTQHPEKVYDIEEVQDLFGLAVEVLNRMTRLIRPA